MDEERVMGVDVDGLHLVPLVVDDGDRSLQRMLRVVRGDVVETEKQCCLEGSPHHTVIKCKAKYGKFVTEKTAGTSSTQRQEGFHCWGGLCHPVRSTVSLGSSCPE